MRIKLQKNILDYLLYFILGFLAFSSLSNYIIENLLHFRFYVIEILFIPLIWYKRKMLIQTFGKIFKIRVFWFLYLLLIFLGSIIIGIIYTGGDFINVITLMRSPIYILILLYIYSENTFSLNKLLMIAYGAILGDSIYALFLSDTVLNKINLIALSLAILIPIVNGNIIQVILASSICVAISIYSGFRIGIILVMLCLFIGFIWILFSKRRKSTDKINQVFYIPIIGILIYLIINNYSAIVIYIAQKFSMDQYAIFRITTRLQSLFLLDFTASQDVQRLNLYSFMWNDFFNKILPRGPVGKSLGVYEFGLYIDVPIIFLYDIFGSVLALIILFIVFKKGLLAFISSFNKNLDKTKIVCGLMFFVYSFLLFTNGRFLTITYESILTGLIFGNWFYKERLK